MTSPIPPGQYGEALLKHVEKGEYPDSEELISSELPTSALPQVAELVEQARLDIKTRIRTASKESAPDIDGWISQAKQLRIDIQRSQAVAKEIVEQAEQNQRIEQEVRDAASKLEFLEGEINFNEELGSALRRLHALQRTLDAIQRSIIDDRLPEAVDSLTAIDNDFSVLPITRNVRILDVFSAKVNDLRKYVFEKLTDNWNSLVRINTSDSSIQIMQNIQGSLRMDLVSTVVALVRLGRFDDFLQPLCKAFSSIIVGPRLQVRPDGSVGSLEIERDRIRILGRSPDLSAHALFEDLQMLIDFLRSNLPPSLVEPLAVRLLPQLVDRLIVIWLASAVPEDLHELEAFRSTIILVKEFGERLEALGWLGNRQLMEWTADIPNVWVKKRQETSLNHIRDLLAKGLGSLETVKRMETQVLARTDEVFTGNGHGDDWNASWSDEETSPETGATLSSPVRTTKVEHADEEDVSAWGLDEDQDDQKPPDNHNKGGASDDDAEAWGWGDDDEADAESNRESPKKTTAQPKEAKSNGIINKADQQKREVTLHETFRITSLPTKILSTINQIISDSTDLETLTFASSPIASAATHLLSLPGLILAMYRASSSHIYLRDPFGPMLLYNDSLWLARSLQELLPKAITSSGTHIESRNAHNLHLDEHVNALEIFGKRAYAKEMESQRTIVTDLLDGAQGFIHCTEHPFNQECDIAVTSTIERLRALHRQWKDILSYSALLQTIGSLLSSITKKMVVDIEDMTDISEPESQQLTSYCNRIATLEDLFHGKPQSAQQESVPLTALYTPHWLKFQYLANILESSLVDIKYLWTEGELGLDFDTEELVDLVVALFADSPHRRNAIAEIRGRRGVR